jgi:hypothetical protein
MIQLGWTAVVAVVAVVDAARERIHCATSGEMKTNTVLEAVEPAVAAGNLSSFDLECTRREASSVLLTPGSFDIFVLACKSNFTAS